MRRRTDRPLPFLRIGLLGLACCLLPGLALRAQDEREAAMHKLRQLRREAEELQEVGQLERAREVAGQARELAAKLERSGHRRAHAHHDDFGDVFNHLEHAIGALREAGRAEHAEKLLEFTRKLRKSLDRQSSEKEGRERRRQPAHDGQNKERQEAKRQLEIMQIAFHTLREARRGDAAERLEQAIHARKLGLEGRRDREAQEIREHAPSRLEQGELLGLAAEIVADHGSEKRARLIGELAHRLAGRHRPRRGERERDRARDEEREEHGERGERHGHGERGERGEHEEREEYEERGEHHEHGEHERRGEHGELREHGERGERSELRELHQRLAELEQAIEELRARLRGRRHQR